MPFLKGRNIITRSQKLEILTRKNGLRHAIFNTVGDKYIGEWKNNSKEGKGCLLTRFRQLYEGDFKEGYRDGFGVLAYENEIKIFKLEYRGDWLKGRMHGFGIRRYRDGSVYIGNWEKGKRHGYGWMWYTNGDFYAGDWVKDKRHGLGMLVKPNICRYEGSWENDMKHGKGRYLHLTTGQMQEGVWIRDICVYSTFKDIRYRQSALYPTKYPIFKNELNNLLEVCEVREMKALNEIIPSCLSLKETLSEMNSPDNVNIFSRCLA